MAAFQNLTETPAFQWMEERAQKFIQSFDDWMNALVHGLGDKLGNGLVMGAQKFAGKVNDALHRVDDFMDRSAERFQFGRGKGDDAPAQEKALSQEITPSVSPAIMEQIARSGLPKIEAREVTSQVEAPHEFRPPVTALGHVQTQSYALGV